MKKIIASILALSILLISGCSHNLVKYSNENELEYFGRINKLCENKDVLSIVTKSNKIFKGKRLVITPDTTSFTNLEFDTFEKISTDEISQIEFEGTYSSWILGLLAGGLAGGLAANILSNPVSGEAGHWKIVTISIGIGIGGLIGTIYSQTNPGKTTIFISKQ